MLIAQYLPTNQAWAAIDAAGLPIGRPAQP